MGQLEEGKTTSVQLEGFQDTVISARKSDTGELLTNGRPIASMGEGVDKAGLVVYWQEGRCRAARLPDFVKRYMDDLYDSYAEGELKLSLKGHCPVMDREEWSNFRRLCGHPEVRYDLCTLNETTNEVVPPRRPSWRLLGHGDPAFDKAYADLQAVRRLLVLVEDAGVTCGELYHLWLAASGTEMFEELIARTLEDEAPRVTCCPLTDDKTDDAKASDVTTSDEPKFIATKKLPKKQVVDMDEHCMHHDPPSPSTCGVCRRVWLHKYLSKAGASALRRGKFVETLVVVADLAGQMPCSAGNSHWLFVSALLIGARWVPQLDADQVLEYVLPNQFEKITPEERRQRMLDQGRQTKILVKLVDDLDACEKLGKFEHDGWAGFMMGIQSKNADSLIYALASMREELRIDGEFWLCHDHETGLLSEKCVGYLIYAGGHHHLGLPNVSSTHGTGESIVRTEKNRLKRALCECHLDGDANWDVIAWEVTAERMQRVYGVPPLRNEAQARTIGIRGMGVVPARGGDRKRQVTPNAVIMAWVARERRTTGGIHVIIQEATGVLARVIVPDKSCEWTAEKAFETKTYGVSEYLTPAPGPAGAVFDTAKQGPFTTIILECDMCGKQRLTLAENAPDSGSCTVIERPDRPGTYWKCDHDENDLLDLRVPDRGVLRDATQIHSLIGYRKYGRGEQYLVRWKEGLGAPSWTNGRLIQGFDEQKAVLKPLPVAQIVEETDGDGETHARVMQGLDDDAVLDLKVTRNLTRKESEREYPHLAWAEAQAKENAVLFKFKCIGDAVETDEARRVSPSHWMDVFGVRAIKGVEHVGEEEARVRDVMGGHNVTNEKGERIKGNEGMHMQCPEPEEVRLFVLVAHLQGFECVLGDASCAYSHSQPAVPTYLRKLPEEFRTCVSEEQWAAAAKLRRPAWPIRNSIYGDPAAGFAFDKWWHDLHVGKLGFEHDAEVSGNIFVLRVKDGAEDDENEDLFGEEVTSDQLQGLTKQQKRKKLLSFLERPKSYGRVKLMMINYVDDEIFAGRAKAVTQYKAAISKWVAIKFFKNLNANAMLGCTHHLYADPNDAGLTWVIFDMRKYRRHALERYQQDVEKGITKKLTKRECETPYTDPSAHMFEKEGTGQQVAPKHLGTWQFQVRQCGPSEAFAVNEIARFVREWSEAMDVKTQHYMSYEEQHSEDVLVGWVHSRDLKEGLLQHATYCDADHGGCRRTGRSTSGVVQYLVGPHGTKAVFGWRSFRQTAASSGTGGSEASAVHAGGRAHLRAQAQIEFLLGEVNEQVYTDSSAARLAIEKGYSKAIGELKKTQKLDIAWIHDALSGILSPVPSDHNVSDVATKKVTVDEFKKHKNFLGEMDYSATLSATRCSGVCRSLIFGAMRCANVVKLPAKRCAACGPGSMGNCDCWYGLDTAAAKKAEAKQAKEEQDMLGVMQEEESSQAKEEHVQFEKSQKSQKQEEYFERLAPVQLMSKQQGKEVDAPRLDSVEFYSLSPLTDLAKQMKAAKLALMELRENAKWELEDRFRYKLAETCFSTWAEMTRVRSYTDQHGKDHDKKLLATAFNVLRMRANEVMTKRADFMTAMRVATNDEGWRDRFPVQGPGEMLNLLVDMQQAKLLTFATIGMALRLTPYELTKSRDAGAVLPSRVNYAIWLANWFFNDELAKRDDGEEEDNDGEDDASLLDDDDWAFHEDAVDLR